MTMQRWSVRGLIVAGAFVLLAFCSPRADASLLTFDLVCVMNQDSALCGNQVPSFGRVTLDDSVAGKIGVSVDLAGTGEKFRDLMLNLSGAGVTSISSLDGVFLSCNGFSISPYAGLFDVGAGGAQGWAGNDSYATTLTGNIPLSLAMFNTLDSLGHVNVALHIQNIGNASGGVCSDDADGTTNCVPGSTGAGSLKIGGLLGVPPSPIDPVPEPMTNVLLGAGLIALSLLRRRRGKSDLP